MDAHILDAISAGAPSVMLVVSAQDLKQIVSEMVADERRRIDREVERRREQYIITADECAKLLHTTKQTLWRWAKDGYLVPKKFGTKVYYRQSDIDNINTTKTT